VSITIANVRDFLVPNPTGKGKRAVFPDEAHVWVGRAAPRWGLRASPLGNPARLRRWSDLIVEIAGQFHWEAFYIKTRQEAVRAFATLWLRPISRMSERGALLSGVPRREMMAELSRLPALHAKHGRLVLVCCCETWDGEGEAPGLCHAEVVREELLRRDA